jgi:hypothetical protein
MMLNRIIKVPKQSFSLMGPCGYGKSTWLSAIFPDAHVFFLPVGKTYQRLLTNPGLFADELAADALWELSCSEKKVI